MHGLTGHDVGPRVGSLVLIQIQLSGEVRPHCDGDCTSTPNKRKGRRIATSFCVRAWCSSAQREISLNSHTSVITKIHCDHSFYHLLNTNVLYTRKITNTRTWNANASGPDRERCAAMDRNGVSELKDWIAYRKEVNSTEDLIDLLCFSL